MLSSRPKIQIPSTNLHDGWVASWGDIRERYYFHNLQSPESVYQLGFPGYGVREIRCPEPPNPTAHPGHVSQWEAVANILSQPGISGRLNPRSEKVLRIRKLVEELNTGAGSPVSPLEATFADLVGALEEERSVTLNQHSKLVDFLHARIKEAWVVAGRAKTGNISDEAIRHTYNPYAMNTTQHLDMNPPVRPTHAYISLSSSLPVLKLSVHSQSLQNETGGSDFVPVLDMLTRAEPECAETNASQSPSLGLEPPPTQNSHTEDSTDNELAMTTKRKRPTEKDPSKFKHKCNTCGELFTRSTTLREHSRTHSGERPFSCSTCSKRFARVKDKNRHQAIHAEERKFRCDPTHHGIGGACGRGFAREDGLVAHLRTDRGWKCLRTVMDSETPWVFVEAKMMDRFGYTCKLTPLACYANFNSFLDLKKHLWEPANRGCVSEWLIQRFLEKIRNEQAYNEEGSSATLAAESLHGSKERSRDIQRTASRSPSPESSRSVDVQNLSALMSSGRHPAEDTPHNRMTNELRPYQDRRQAGEAGLDVDHFTGWVLVASGYDNGLIDRVWIQIKCPMPLDSQFLFRIGEDVEVAWRTFFGRTALDGYSYRLEARNPWQVMPATQPNGDLAVKIIKKNNLESSFPVGTLHPKMQGRRGEWVMDSSAYIPTNVHPTHTSPQEGMINVENAPSRASEHDDPIASRLPLQEPTNGSGHLAGPHRMSESNRTSDPELFSE